MAFCPLQLQELLSQAKSIFQWIKTTLAMMTKIHNKKGKPNVLMSSKISNLIQTGSFPQNRKYYLKCLSNHLKLFHHLSSLMIKSFLLLKCIDSIWKIWFLCSVIPIKELLYWFSAQMHIKSPRTPVMLTVFNVDISITVSCHCSKGDFPYTGRDGMNESTIPQLSSSVWNFQGSCTNIPILEPGESRY